MKIIVSKHFDVSVNRLWKAITEHTQMIQWFFDNIPDFKAEVGFKTAFNVNSGQRDFMHLWEIVEVIPNKKIVYNWRYKDFEGNSYCTFEINQHKNQTELSIIAEGIETFTADIPEFKPESCRAGWEYFIGRLAQYLESK